MSNNTLPLDAVLYEYLLSDFSRESEVLAPPRDDLHGTRIDAGEAGSFDSASINTGKEKYRNYNEDTLQLLRPGGLVAIDNTLRQGDVADPAKQDPQMWVTGVLDAVIFR